MLEKIYNVTDLGPGDGGKGGVVHSLARKIDASVVIKRGGAQGSHGVRTSSGESFNFSQWCCGTFDAIPTYCSSQMILSPAGLENESEALKKLGIYDPYVLLSVDPSCICASPFHMISSQLEELMLGKNPRGTIGTGVGRAYRMYNELGDGMTIRASQLIDREVVQTKLKRQLDYYRDRYPYRRIDNGIPEDAKLITENLDLLYDDGFLPYIVDLFENVGKRLCVKELDEILQYDGSAVVECSHGILTDAEEGLKPHVSAIRTLPKFTWDMLRDAGYNGQIINLGVHRAYEIRHGAGPMPTYDPEFTSKMLPGSHKDENRWQGIVRAGPLDINLLRYAIMAARDTDFDGICLTWFDQILSNWGSWEICTQYQELSNFDETYTEFLKRAKPVIVNYLIRHLTLKREEIFDVVKDVLADHIGVPLSILSLGPTEVDKIINI